MAKIIQLRKAPIRPVECERALALMREAKAILDDLVDRELVEAGSPPEATLYYLDNAIGMLKPFDDDEVAHG